MKAVSVSYKNSETQSDSNRQFFCYCFGRSIAPPSAYTSGGVPFWDEFFFSSTHPHFTFRMNIQILIRAHTDTIQQYDWWLLCVDNRSFFVLIFSPHTWKFVNRHLNILNYTNWMPDKYDCELHRRKVNFFLLLNCKLCYLFSIHTSHWLYFVMNNNLGLYILMQLCPNWIE